MAVHEKVALKDLFAMIDDAMEKAKSHLQQIKEQGDSISIGDMFEMQMRMNKLAQLSETATGVASASHTACMSMARNIKG